MSYPVDLPKIVAAAIIAEVATGLPALLSAAQCAVECAWLDHAPKNNAFGVKWHKSQDPNQRQLLTTLEWFNAKQLQAWLSEPAYAGRIVIRETGRSNGNAKEYQVKDWFMTYPSLGDSFTAHARLITTGYPYRKAWEAYQQHRSPERLAREIGPTYATAPSYTKTVLQVMAMDALRKAIQRARE